MRQHKKPNRSKSLVTGWLDIVRVSDALLHRVGIMIVGKCMAVCPVVCWLECAQDIKKSVISSANPEGHITNSDLCGPPSHLACQRDTCAKLNAQASRSIQQQQPLSQLDAMVGIMMFTGGNVAPDGPMNASTQGIPSHTLHIAGKWNRMTDISSHSFGSMPWWHCTTDSDFLALYNNLFL